MLSPDHQIYSTKAGGVGSTTKQNLNSLNPASSSPSSDLVPPPESKRKFSFPIALHSSSLLGEYNTLSARRRLSSVSDVVTRKLSNTIGWKIPTTVPTQDLITQSKCLCGQYIRFRLKRSGLFTKKLGLQRLRSIIGTPSAQIVREVFPALNYIGAELERMHPALYTNILRQIARPTNGELQTADTVVVILSAVARDLFRSDITWSKVVALFAITGGLAVDCVRQDHPEYLPRLVEGMADVVEDELVSWINENGGWGGLPIHTNPANTQFSYVERIALIIGCAFGVFVLYFTLRFLSYHIIWCLIWIR